MRPGLGVSLSESSSIPASPLVNAIGNYSELSLHLLRCPEFCRFCAADFVHTLGSLLGLVVGPRVRLCRRLFGCERLVGLLRCLVVVDDLVQPVNLALDRLDVLIDRLARAVVAV